MNRNSVQSIPENFLEENIRLVTKQDDMIYAFINHVGLIVSYSLMTEEWRIEAIVPDKYKTIADRLFAGIAIEKQKIFIYSIFSETILMFDRITKELIEIYLVEEKVNENKIWSSIIKIESGFVFIPFDGDEIITFDVDTCNIEKHKTWKKSLMDALKKHNLQFGFLRRNSACVCNGKMYMVVRCITRDVVISIRISSMSFESLYQPECDGMLWGMYKTETGIWMQNILDEESQFILWDFINNSIVKKTVAEGVGRIRANFINEKYIIPIAVMENEEVYYPIGCSLENIIAVNLTKKRIEIFLEKEKERIIISFKHEWNIKLFFDMIERGRDHRILEENVGKNIYNSIVKG